MPKLYTHDVNYFDTPTVRSAYVAGFIAADGSIGLHNKVAIGLKGSDKPFLEAVKDEISYTGPVHYKMQKCGFPRALMVVCGARKVVQDLRRIYNITPRKTYTLQPPNLVDDAHILSYIKGFSDGDGSVFVQTNSRGTKIIRWTLVGASLPFLKWVHANIIRITGVQSDSKFSKVGKNVHSFSFNGTLCVEALAPMSELDTLCLTRKWDTFHDYVQEKNAYCDNLLQERARNLMVDTSCSQCGKVVQRRPKQVEANESGRAFCSRRCVVAWRTERNLIDGRITVPCGACGTTLTRKTSALARSKSGRLFCSSECVATYYKKIKTPA